MPRPDFNSLQSQLLRTGIAPRHVHRTITEMNDHFDDLVEDAVQSGLDEAGAERHANQELGDMNLIAAAVCERPELRGWAANHPRVALVVYPLACLAVLPALPVIAGVANASYLARWIACAILSGLVTASILLLLQLSITLT